MVGVAPDCNVGVYKITQLDMATPCDNEYCRIFGDILNVKIGNHYLNEELVYILYKVQGRFELLKLI